MHTAVWIPEDDRAFATRLARYCARNPVALERLTYDRAATTVTYRSDKSEGPTAGTETADPLEFLARVLVHIPDTGQVTTRYWYANRPRGMRRQAEPAADAPVPIVTTPRLVPTEATRRWAALLRQIYEVDPLACPRCAGPMRIVACITQSAVIDQILTHLRTRAASGARPGARSPPATAATVARGVRRRPDRKRGAPPRALRVLQFLNAAPRPPAHGSGPFGARGDPTSVRRHGATTCRGAEGTTRDAGRRATDGRTTPPGPHAGWWRGVKRRGILPRPRLKLLSRDENFYVKPMKVIR